MKNSLIGSLFLLIFSTSIGPPSAFSETQPRILSGQAITYLGGQLDADKFVTDTLQIYGGPLSNEGRFQDAGNASLPDWQGWVGMDFSTVNDTLWNVSDYYCANLDPTEPDNHAWWCGQTFSACFPGDDPNGYGNNIREYLQWRMPPQDADFPVTVRVTAVLNMDMEPGEDYLHLMYLRDDDGPLEQYTVWTHTGTLTAHAFDLTFEVPAAWLDEDEVWLAWVAYSDGAWSDSDCLWQTNGAAQIDLIGVSFDQGEGAQQMGVTEDCENPQTLQWSPYIQPGTGVFAQIWPLLDDLDEDRQNTTPQAGFIDDGLVVPGTGGSTNPTWTYGPGGYVLNDSGGLSSEKDLRSYIVSPPIAWATSYQGALLEFDIYEHLPLGAGMFWRWKIRSTLDPTGLTGWSAWKNSSLYRCDVPRYRRHKADLTASLPEARAYVQIALGVEDWGPVYYLNDDVTPAPYFDNVSLKAYRITGPQIIAIERELPQDNFPEAGVIDPVNLADNSVRFDMGDQADGNFMSRRDSVIIKTTAIRNGAVLDRMPRMYYKLYANPLFDTARSSGLPLDGYVEADSARADGLTYADQWAFDLPDSGFLFPGDVLHVYFTATDNLDGDIRTASLPADTTGFSIAPGDPGYEPLQWPEAFTVRALPAVTSLAPVQHAEILLWDDSELEETRQRWVDGLQLAFPDDPGAWDIFVSNGATERLGNGLGGLATADLLGGYKTIIYAGGTHSGATMYFADPAHDAQMLLDWLDYDSTPRGLLISGCHVASDLVVFGTAEAELLSRLGVDPYSNDLVPLVGDQPTPEVLADAVSPFQDSRWIVDGGYPSYHTIDAVTATAGSIRIAQFLDPVGTPDTYDWAALTLAQNGDDLLLAMPYDIILVEDAPGHAGRDAYLQVILRAMETVGFQGRYGSSPRLPEVFTASAYPNPFNPQTRIFWTAPAAGRLSIDLYNLRGEKVRSLLERRVADGPGHVVWDGSGSSGENLASGVYFCRVALENEVRLVKLTLLK